MNEKMMSPDSTGLTVNERMKFDLLSAAKWAKFLCVMMIFFSAVLSGVAPNMPFGAFVGFLYLVMAALYIYPIVKGFQFANGTKAACLTGDENELARGFAGLRSLLRFIGVLTIICMALYVLIIIGVIIVALIAK